VQEKRQGRRGPGAWTVESHQRRGLLATHVLAPAAVGSELWFAYKPLLAVCFTAGIVSWVRGRVARANGADLPAVPARAPLLGLVALGAAQLVPLPPTLLGWLSPGSLDFWCRGPVIYYLRPAPITVNPSLTQWAVADLLAVVLLYGAAFRELGAPPWPRRLGVALSISGVLLSVEALVQAAVWGPRIWGVWTPPFEWAVYGPYVNRNHYAGYMAMIIPVVLAFTAEAWGRAARAFARRGWRSLFDPPASDVVRRIALVLLMVVAVMGSQSRGGLAACVIGVVVVAAAVRELRFAAVAVTMAATAISSWLVLNGSFRGMESGFEASRMVLWRDVFRMTRHFALVGSGLGSFPTAYQPFKTVWLTSGVFSAHNEYLQVLVEVGLAGAVLAAMALVRVLWLARRGAAEAVLTAGFFAGLVATSLHSVVDYDLHVPANAATFAVMAGVAVRRGLAAATETATAPDLAAAS
jgi:O-antigen ligase